MKKKNSLKLVSALTGAATLTAQAAQVVAEQPAPAAADITVREDASYDKIANVSGSFEFDQNVICPSDEVFNLFGTVATAMCARPGFAFDKVDSEQYFINFGGSVLKYQTVSLDDLKAQGTETRTLKCSCATSPAVANAQVVGVPLSNIMQMVDLEDQTNTITFKAADGYSVSMPLTYALEKDTILVYQIGGTPVPTGVQVWVPKSVARYFARNVVDIEFSKQESTPDIIQADASQRAKISVLNRFEDTTFAVGDQIEFDGYADDFDTAIAAIEFSMDGGETWTACETKDATADKWVYWHFGYVTEKPGTYKLDVRARTAAGNVSPLAASIVFNVK